MKYESAGDYFIKYRAGDVREQPHNPGDVRLVLYETWMASVHQVGDFLLDQRIVNFTNVFYQGVRLISLPTRMYTLFIDTTTPAVYSTITATAKYKL